MLLGKDEAKNRLAWVQNAQFVRPGPLSQLIAFAQRSGDAAFLKQSLTFLPKVQLGNTVGYASLISTLSTTNNVDEMFYIYGRMKGERVPLNIHCAAALINTSLRHNKIDRAFEVLSDLKKSNARIDSGLVNSFVSYFLERRDVDRLLSVLDIMGERGDIHIDRVAILDSMWQKLASPHEDLSLAYQFIERLTAALPVREPTTSTSTTAATQPSDSSEPPHQHQLPGGVGDDENMERKEGDQLPQDKWTLVAAYWRRRIDQLLYQLITRGDTARAQGLVELMVRRWQIQPNRRSVTMHIKTSVREAVARAAAAASAGQGHGRDGGEVARLAKMVEEGELEADGITFTALIDANGRLGRKAEALRLYELMRARGVERDAGTYKVLLITCAVAKDKHEGLRLLALAEQDGMALDEGPLAAVTSTIRSLPDPSSPAPPPS